MAAFSSRSQQALQRLKAYCARCASSIYTQIPTKSRAAVLLVLFPSRQGDIRIVLTQRASHMRTFPGQVALPGGKAEEGETAFQTARREAYEEIGLPLSGTGIGWRVVELGEWPCGLSITKKVVRPCIAYIENESMKDVEKQLVPVLEEGGEVESVFACDLEDFLSASKLPYRGESKSRWYDTEWVMHEFMVPKTRGEGSFRVWGMTARILVDVARIAYGRDPEFDFVDNVGAEPVVKRLLEQGQFGERKERL